MTDILNDEMIPEEELLDKEKEGLGLIPGTPDEGDFYPEEETPLPVGTRRVYTDNDKNTATYIIKRFVQRGGFALTYEVELVGLKDSRLILKEFCPKNARRHRTGTIENTRDENYSKGLSKFRREPDRIDWIKQNLNNNKDLAEHVALSRTPVFRSKEGNSYFVQDFVEGETLMEFMSRPVKGCTPMSVSLALDIAVALCKAVSVIHHAGIAHMDLAPGNIIFKRKKGSVELKVIDFGLSTTVDKKGGSGSAINGGTPGFLDQQLTQYDTKNIDYRNADIFSIGALLNYMLFFSYDFAGREEKGFGFNYDSMSDLGGAQPFAALSNDKDEYRRKPLVELIKKATQKVPKVAGSDFRPDVDELLMELNKIKADLYLERNTLQRMNEELPAEGDKKNISFHAEMIWNAMVQYPDSTPEDERKWIALDKYVADENDRNVVATVERNENDTPREAKIIIESGVIQETYIVRQAAGTQMEPEPKPAVAVPTPQPPAPVAETASRLMPASQPAQVTEPAVKPVQTAEPVKKPTVADNPKPAVKTGKKPEEKLVEKPMDKPVDKSAETLAEKPTVKPAEKPTQVAEPAAKPIQAAEPAKKPTVAVTPKPAEKPSVKPSVSPTAEQAVKPAEKPVVKPTVKPTVKPVEKPEVKPEVKPTAKPTEKPMTEPVNTPKTGSTEKEKEKSKSWVVWVVIGLLVAGAAYWFYNGSGNSGNTQDPDRTPAPSGVVQSAGTSQEAPQQTDDGQGASEPKTVDVKAFNAAIILAKDSPEWQKTVLGLLHPSVTIYERYGNSDVEVGSSMRQLLQGEDVNIVPGVTHRVTQLHTDPATGLINEIIIEKKP